MNAARANSQRPTSRAASGALAGTASLTKARYRLGLKSDAWSAPTVPAERLPALRRLAERSARPSVGKKAGFVGAGRFELPTSRTRTVRATKLRYAP